MSGSLHRRARASRAAIALAIAASVLAGCTAGAPILANPTAPGPVVPSPAATSQAVADPIPVVLPRDDGPHDRLTEWWYDTGHLRTADGRRFGFEYVIFRAERGAFPTSWASHLAITDETGDRFVYAQRLEVGPSGRPLAPRRRRPADGLRPLADGSGPVGPGHGRARRPGR